MFSTLEKIKDLAKKKGISLAKLEESLGYSTNYFYTLKTKAPNAERLAEIANYFNVSTDYLLGRTDNPRIASNENDNLMDTQELNTLVMFRKETENMTDLEKERFNNALSGLMQTARSLIEDDSNWK
ncbi:helix-turn-helix transcriptional regulator [Streptococcus sp. ZY19097]|uniref:helix-turn-helix domain-containing protein n=1 Tax=Streptococcus sp. ZY19097 TaxID=3231906 RepID=UPI00345A6DF1